MNTSTSFKQRTLKLSVVAFACAAALISGPSSAATNSANATTSGTVIVPITVVNAKPLTFGRFAAGASGGTVTIGTDGVRVSSGTIVKSSIGASSLTAARFDVTGDPSATYGITYSANNVLTNGGQSMSLDLVSDTSAGGAATTTIDNGTLDGLGVQSIYVGGVLTVAAGQATGDYAGTVAVTVQYN